MVKRQVDPAKPCRRRSGLWPRRPLAGLVLAIAPLSRRAPLKQKRPPERLTPRRPSHGQRQEMKSLARETMAASKPAKAPKRHAPERNSPCHKLNHETSDHPLSLSAVTTVGHNANLNHHGPPIKDLWKIIFAVMNRGFAPDTDSGAAILDHARNFWPGGQPAFAAVDRHTEFAAAERERIEDRIARGHSRGAECAAAGDRH